MNQQLDNFMAYNILSRLRTPFNAWPAYKYGIIDKDGNVLKKQNILTSTEKQIFGKFDLICLNLKKIIGKIPQYNVALAPLNQLQNPPFDNNINSPISFGALTGSFFLLKETVEDPDNILFLEKRMEYYYKIVNNILEDAPTNSVGGGNVAGIGVGPSGEPGVPPNTPYKKKNKYQEEKITRMINRIKGGC
jgi:hypothetical protein